MKFEDIQEASVWCDVQVGNFCT